MTDRHASERVIDFVGIRNHAVRVEEDVRQIARYIVANPLRAGLVRDLGEYSLWDCAWL